MRADLRPWSQRCPGEASGSVWVALTAPAELWRYDAKGATLLAGALVPNTEIAVDAAHAYWISPGVGVLRVPR